MRLLFITQTVDRTDWLLGFTHGWLKALAARVEGLTVICLGQGETDLPPNVRVISLGKERSIGRLGRALRFAQALAECSGGVDGVLAHMSPVFAIAAAPFAKVRRLPLVLWYTHRHADLKLRLATALCDAVVTASPESFRLPTPKVRVVGHGIDPDQFSPRRMPESPPLLVSVGRLSPVKRHELLIDAMSVLRDRGVNARCVIIGSTPPGDEAYVRMLQERNRDAIEFAGAVPHTRIPAWYARCGTSVNLCPTGGLDKAVLEAMFCACPVLVTNRGFEPLLGKEGSSWLVAEDPASVANGLAELLADPAAQQKADAIRSRALAAHGLDRLMDRLIGVFQSLQPAI